MRAEEYVVEEGWQQVLCLLPDDLEQSARQDKAIIRLRKIRDAATLLRVILAYSLSDLSSRGLSSWWSGLGLGSISSISLLQRLRWSAYWLAGLLAEMLEEFADRPDIELGGRSLIIQDASTVSRAGSKGIDRRVHLSLSLAPYRIVAIELSDVSGGETFTRMDVGPGDIVMGDRGYAHPRGIRYVAGRGADVLVRVNWQNVPFVDEEGNRFDVTAHLKSMEGEIGEWRVAVRGEEEQGIAAVSGRLVAKRKEPDDAAKERKRIIKRARKKNRVPDPRSLIAAGFILIFTTLSEDVASSEQVMELFRYRWQVERTFKRLKGVLKLDELPDCSDELLDTIILGRLIGAILIQKIASKAGAFSPSGPGRPSSGKRGSSLEDDTAGDTYGSAGRQFACGLA